LTTSTGITSFLPARAYESVICLFKDSEGKAVSVTNAEFSLLLDGLPIIDKQSLSPIPDYLGYYKYSWWITDDYVSGLYDIAFTGNNGSESLSLAGQVQIGEITRVQSFINRLLSRLLDKHFERYLIDAPERQWQDQDLYHFLLDALDSVNNSSPVSTAFTFDNLPCESIFLDIAQGYALLAMARLENANTFSYSDGISLNLNRAPFYQQQGQYLLDNALKVRLAAWKYSSSLTRPRPVGLRRARLPFRVMRALGFMPNMKRSFGF